MIHSLIGYFGIQGNNTGVISSTLSFLFVYDQTSGPVAWLYAAETTSDAALGFCLLVLWGTVFVLSLVCPILMQPDSLGPSNVFFILSGISVVGAAYSFFIIKETRCLTDKDKKLLFTPQKYIEQAKSEENVIKEQEQERKI